MSEIRIYASTSQVKVMEIKNILDAEGITYHEMNKLDSSYAGIFGEIQLFVASADAEKAQSLVAGLKN